jgi:hypothetical protein
MSITCDVGTLFYYDMFFELERWRREIPLGWNVRGGCAGERDAGGVWWLVHQPLPVGAAAAPTGQHPGMLRAP